MSALSNHINELQASEAFSKQAAVFDEQYGNDAIIQYKRQRVRQHILAHATSRCRMLELNCGTGDDALFFALEGYWVHATDISESMLQKLHLKREHSVAASKISTEVCSFTALEGLENKGPYDYVYSNFGGLNCSSELHKVLAEIERLINPGGTITLVLISKFCMWEMLLVFKGKFRTAFRRFFSGKGRKANVEGRRFTCWYYNLKDIKRQLPPSLQIVDLEGLCTIVPPSYFDRFAEKHPKAFAWMKKKEDALKKKWPWKYWGDYFIVSIRKKGG